MQGLLRALRQDSRGVAVTEFAIWATLFFFGVMAALDFGDFYIKRGQLNDALAVSTVGAFQNRDNVAFADIQAEVRNMAQNQSLTVTVTDVNDGVTYNFTGVNGTDLAAWNSDWTRDGTSGAITIDTNAAKSNNVANFNAYTLASLGTADIECRVTLTNATSAGPLVCPRSQDKDNFLGVAFSGGTPRIYRCNAGTLTTLLDLGTPYLSPSGSNTEMWVQILNNTFNVYLRGVLIGSYDVTGMLTGVTTPGLVNRSTSTARVDNFNARAAVAHASLVGLYNLTMTPLTGTAGAAYAGALSGVTTGSSVAVTTDTSGLFFADGVTIRALAPGAGSYPITVTETYPGAVNSPRTTNFTITIS